jgi:hypothetical protein
MDAMLGLVRVDAREGLEDLHDIVRR